MKLSLDDDNVNLILIWPHRHFQQKNAKVLCCQNTGVEVLEMRYWYSVMYWYLKP